MRKQMNLYLHQGNTNIQKNHLKHKNVRYCNCVKIKDLNIETRLLEILVQLEHPFLDCPLHNTLHIQR